MATTVTARPNHYELLGLRPTASTDEIFAAFRKAMGLFAAPPSAVAAQLSVAFETLRNPAKRRAYDEANGLTVKPAPEPAVRPKPVAASFIASASYDSAAQALRDKLAKLAAPAEPAAEARPDSSIASSVRVTGEPWPAPARDAPVQPKLEREPPRTAAPTVAPLAPAHLEDAAIAEDSLLDWKRPALIAGGLVAVAALVGGLAGVSVRDGPAPKAATAATAAKGRVTVPLPTATHAEASEPTPLPAVETHASAPLPAPAKAVPPRRRPAPAQAAAVPDSSPAAPPPLESAIADSPSDAPPAPAQAASSSLPLPNSVIARTIARIGYWCGSVVSTAAVDGAPGAYTITCSSGQSFQASPVRGRYHFRRLGKP